MNEETLPPSPNWYLSNILTCIEDGIIAYGARNHIVIGKYLPCTPVNQTPKITLISNAHKERVTVVAPNRSKDVSNSYWHCLASAGDDSVIRVWNWDDSTLLLVNNSHAEGSKISAMDWSTLDPNLVVSADDQGTVVTWDLFTNTSQRLIFGKMVPTCISCCPHKREIIALGTRSGLVCTISLKGGGKMLHRLRGHDAEIVSLAWCPVVYNVYPGKESQEDVLLASGAKENAIYIWRVGGDGRYETVIHLPSVPLAQDAPGSQQHRTRLGASAAAGKEVGGGGGGWTCLCWPEPYTLLSSSLFGELVSFNLQQNLNLKSSKPAFVTRLWKLVHACHARGLFSIAHVPWKGLGTVDVNPVENGLLKENGVSESKYNTDLKKEVTFEDENMNQVIWTTAQDRNLVAYCWKTGKILMNVPTLGGFVYCIATSPLDSNRLALGVGDGTIRIWNLSNSTSLEIATLWQKIKGKVMALAWHPSKEGCLAYGTSEGRIGLYDVSCGKLPVLFRPYHRRSVYSLCWGPSICSTDGKSDNGIFLFSCGDGEIIQYNSEKPNEEPFNLKQVLHVPDTSSQKNILRTDVAWKPDYSLLAVGSEDGTVNILSASSNKIIFSLLAHKKLIQCLAWHPVSTATDAGFSPFQHWLAVASNETSVKVFDLSQLIEHGENLDCKPQTSLENCITLSGHLNRVVSMCWSPHIGGQLVSVSYDNTAQVWNVPAQQPVVNFCLHSNHVYCCAWSPLDPDLVITGSADFTLRVWKISEQSQALPAERKKQKKTETKRVTAVVAKLESSELSNHQEKEENLQHSVVPDRAVDYIIENGNDEKPSEATVQYIKKKKPNVRKSFFPASSTYQNHGKGHHFANCYHLLRALDNIPATDNEGDDTTKLPFYLGFFGDQNDTKKLLDIEIEHHISNGNVEMAQHMEIWKGNITDMLREAARCKKLNDWLVSLAPMASQKLWMEMCKAYSDQLAQAGYYQKAASYLLVCHKVNDAIDLLISHQLFREAVAIARCRFGPEDPTPKKIINTWAQYVASEGNYELAVECLISVGELLEAAMIIRKRNDENSLKLAALIARKAGAQELTCLLACQSLKQSLLVKNWDVAEEVSSQHRELKYLAFMFSVHRLVFELAAVNQTMLCPQWILNSEQLLRTNKPFFEEVEMRLKTDINEEERQDTYVTLLREFGKNEMPDTVDKMWFVVSVELALAYMSDGVTRWHHIIAALNTCYQFKQMQPPGEHHPMLQLCMWLAPQGPFSHNSLFSPIESEDLKCISRSVRAYLCVGVVDWVTENMESEVTENKNVTENGCGETEQCQKRIDVWNGLPEFLSVCMNDVITKDSLQYFQDCVKIKKWEHEIATAVAKVRKGDGSGDGCDISSDTTDNVLFKLEKLKKSKQEFESNYASTPNPFIAYCKIKNLLTVKKESKSYEDLYMQFENLWKQITSDV